MRQISPRASGAAQHGPRRRSARNVFATPHIPGAVIVGVLGVGLLLTSGGEAMAVTPTSTTAPASTPVSTPVSYGSVTTGSTETALVNAYAAGRGIPAAAVAGVRTDSLKTATIASTHTNWAVASFLPSTADSATVTDSFQDGASTGVFSSVDGAAWKFVQTGGAPLSCAGVLPAAVQRALQLTASIGGCASPVPETTSATTASATTPSVSAAAVAPSKIVSTANGSVGVSDSPKTTSFGFDCNPYTTLVGNPDGASKSGCGYNSRYKVTNTNEEWCADYTKYVWKEGGVTKDLGTLDPGAASFYTWGKQQGEHMPVDPAAKDAKPGDAVVFYPAKTTPNGGYADHVGIVVKVNSNGTLDLVNGDFLGGSNISVQANNNVDLGKWASEVWASGEEWIFVSPS